MTSKVPAVNRRRSARLGIVIAALVVLPAVTSCSTFNRNDVAAKVGDRSLSSEAVEALAGTPDGAATGDQLREQLTKWIRVTVLEASNGTSAPSAPVTSADLDARLSQAITTIAGDKARTTYESGLGGSSVVCLAAITVANIDDANNVLATVNGGTTFADAAHQFSTDAAIAQSGGIVRSQDGSECIDAGSLNPDVTAALKGTPIGQPIAADLTTFSAVLMLRPFDELLPESKSLIAATAVSQEQLDAIIESADIYVDSRYGRWDPATGSVVTLNS
jgi:hypothetical protein